MADAVSLFYGNPESVKLMNVGIKSLTDSDTNHQIAQFDEVVKPLLEADLATIFSAWPAADSTNKNPISTLWLFLMSAFLQEVRYASNIPNAVSDFGKDMSDRYEDLLDRIKSGKTVVPGATRVVAWPVGQAYTDWRVYMGGIGDKRPDGPRDLDTLIPRGLRRGGAQNSSRSYW